MAIGKMLAALALLAVICPGYSMHLSGRKNVFEDDLSWLAALSDSTQRGDVDDIQFGDLRDTELDDSDDTPLDDPNDIKLNVADDTQFSDLSDTKLDDLHDTKLDDSENAQLDDSEDTQLDDSEDTQLDDAEDTPPDDSEDTQLDELDDTGLNDLDNTHLDYSHDIKLDDSKDTHLEELDDSESTQLDNSNNIPFDDQAEIQLDELDDTRPSDLDNTQLDDAHDIKLDDSEDTHLEELDDSKSTQLDKSNKIPFDDQAEIQLDELDDTRPSDLDNTQLDDAHDIKLDDSEDTHLEELDDSKSTQLDNSNKIPFDDQEETQLDEVDDTSLSDLDNTQLEDSHDIKLDDSEDTHLDELDDAKLDNLDNTQLDDSEDPQLDELDDSENAQLDDLDNTPLDDSEDAQLDLSKDTQLDDSEDTQVDELDDSDNAQLDDSEDTQLDDSEDTQLDDSEDTQLDDSEDTQLDLSENTQLDDSEDAQLDDSEETQRDDSHDIEFDESVHTPLKNAFNILLNEPGDIQLPDIYDIKLDDSNHAQLDDSHDINLDASDNAQLDDSRDINLDNSDDAQLVDSHDINLDASDDAQLDDSDDAELDDSHDINLDDSENAQLDDSEDTQLDDSEGTQADDSEDTQLDDSEDTQLDDSEDTQLDELDASEHAQLDDSEETQLDDSHDIEYDESVHTPLKNAFNILFHEPGDIQLPDIYNMKLDGFDHAQLDDSHDINLDASDNAQLDDSRNISLDDSDDAQLDDSDDAELDDSHDINLDDSDDAQLDNSRNIRLHDSAETPLGDLYDMKLDDSDVNQLYDSKNAELDDSNNIEHDNTLDNEVNTNDYETCDILTCRLAALNFLDSMNKSVNPCDDFYEFTCGAWRGSDRIPPFYEMWDRFKSILESIKFNVAVSLIAKPLASDIVPVRQAKRWYTSCVGAEILLHHHVDKTKQRGVKPIASILMQAGSWPITMEKDEWDVFEYPWQKVERFYARLMGSPTLYSVQSTPFDRPNILAPDVPTDYFKLVSWSYNGKDYDEYIRAVKKTVKLFITANVTEERIVEDVKAIVDFEKQIYELKQKKLDYRRMTFDKFVEFYDNNITDANTKSQAKINWRSMLEEISDMLNIKVNTSMSVFGFDYAYVKGISQLLQRTPARTIVNYIHWNFVAKMLKYTTDEAPDSVFDLRKYLYGTERIVNRYKECVNELPMPDVAAYLFIKEHYSNSSEPVVREMINNIQIELKHQIENSNWLDAESKKWARQKLKKMQLLVGVPDWYKRGKNIVKKYKGLVIGTDYFDNGLSSVKFLALQKLRALAFPEEQSRDPWFGINPLEPNVYYDAAYNMFAAPTVAMPEAFLSSEFPSNIKYGIAGVVLAKGLGHAFDITGIRYGSTLNAPKLPDYVLKNYKKRAECFIDQYAEYYHGYFGRNASGSEGRPFSSPRKLSAQMKDGYIASSIGLQAAFKAYKKLSEKFSHGDKRLSELKNVTDDQMFFIAFGNTFCEAYPDGSQRKRIEAASMQALGRFTVNGAISNTKGFAKAFNCPIGSPMNPRKKCNIWEKPETQMENRLRWLRQLER